MMKKLLAPAIFLGLLTFPVNAKPSFDLPKDVSDSAVQISGEKIEISQLGIKQSPITCGPHQISIEESRNIIESIVSGIGVTLGKENIGIDVNNDWKVSKQELDSFLKNVSQKLKVPVQAVIDQVVDQYIQILQDSDSEICNDYFPQKK